MARAGSYAAAARELHLTQPALWRQVRALETELGVSLFVRVGRRVEITPEGTELARRASEVLAEADRFATAAAALGAGMRGRVRVACLSPHVARCIAGVMRILRADAPDIEVELFEAPSASATMLRFDDLLRNGAVDFAVGIPAITGVTRRHLYRAEVVLGTPPGHRWARRRRVDVRELVDEPLLAPPVGWFSRTQLDAAAQSRGFEPAIAYESPSAATLLALANAAIGTLVIADDAALPFGERWPRLTHNNEVLGSPVELYWLADRPMTGAGKAFLAAVDVAP